MDDQQTTFAETYGSVIPEHPIFERCPECGDYTHEGIAILGLASQLGDVVAQNLAFHGSPPEIIDFLMTIILSSAATTLVGMKRENSSITTVLEVLPQIEDIINGLVRRLPAELERVRAAAVVQARTQGVAGTC